MSQSPKQPPQDKLDTIIHYLEQMNRRDRLRTYGGLVRSILGFIPLVLLLGSLWYVYAHTEEFLRTISQEAARAAAEYSNGGEFMKNLQNMMKR